MEGIIWYFVATVFTAGFALAIGTLATASAQGRALAQAMDGIARQPEAAGSIRGTLIIGLAFIEALTIYVLLIALILIFVNPYGEKLLALVSGAKP